MDGLARPAGAGIVIRIPKGWPTPTPDGGFDEYFWPPMRIEEYAIVEQHLLKNRVSPIDAVLPELERLAKQKTRGARKLADALTERAYNDLRKSREQNRVTVDEVQAWIDTPEGVLFTMKLCLARHHPNITDAEVRRIFDWLGEEEARRQRDIAQGIDALGNSTGPSRVLEGTGAIGPKETSDVSRGGASIAGSLASTDGASA